MAKNAFRDASGKLLNSTEKQAISKIMKIHQPMLREMEKWKDQREKLESTLFDQIERIGQFLEPYGNQSRETLMGLTGQRQPKAKYSSKKASSSRKTVSSKKVASPKRSSKPKSRTAKKSK